MMINDSVIIYMTPDEKEILIGQKSDIPNGDTIEVTRFMELALATMERGYKGIDADSIKLSGGEFVILWKFYETTIEGTLLKEIAQNALAGIMPPDDSHFFTRLKIIGEQL